MIDWFSSESMRAVYEGFSAVSGDPMLWLLVLAGTLLGMVVGILPGFGPPAAMALLFPLTYVMPPLSGIAMLAGIFYGAKYGGAVTSILLGIPGAQILSFDEDHLHECSYEETESYQITEMFINHREALLNRLLGE